MHGNGRKFCHAHIKYAASDPLKDMEQKVTCTVMVVGMGQDSQICVEDESMWE